MKSLIYIIVFLFGNIIYAQSSVEIKVYGKCGMCQDRIESTALGTIGVTSAAWAENTQLLKLEVDSFMFEEDELHQKMIGIGHDTDKFRATDDDYDALHTCCKYDRPIDDSYLNNNAHDESDDHDHDGSEDHVLDTSTSNTKLMSGYVFEENESEEEIPIIGANVYWESDNLGTVTDINGLFSLESRVQENLVLSYVGFNNDTLFINQEGDIKVIMQNNIVLDGVDIVQRRGSSEFSFIEPIKILKISEKELMKAACCNLSESFETIPSVDVSTTDAISGKRRIEMLGLAGPYVQITLENMPFARGLAAVNGLSYLPGPWVEGMMLNQGSGSVVNGYESIAGQINIELKKTNHKEDLLVNLFGNEAKRFEFNVTSRSNINEKWNSAQLIHGSIHQENHDRNEDGFLDMPKNKTFGVVNRWSYYSESGVMGQVGISGYYDEVVAGQKGFDPQNSNRSIVWGSENKTKRLALWAKRGMVFEDKPYQSIGLQFSSSYQDQEAYFGLKPYEASHTSLYFNGIFQSRINNENHQYKTGISLNYDNIDEKVELGEFERNEFVPGAFFEYTYTQDETWTIVGGLRADHHNSYGLFVTPRFHLRYAPSETLVFRANAGIGHRTANVFVENMGFFASSRNFIIHSQDNSNPYGLDQEKATGVGASITKVIQLFNNDATLSVEAHHIAFENQIVYDSDFSARELNIYNLSGKSFSNSVQTQFEFRPSNAFVVRLAYRYNDVQTDYLSGRLQKPLNSPHRAFANFEIDLGHSWKLDYTYNWQGSQRLPNTLQNPENLRRPYESNSFTVSNFQVSKSWNEIFDVYIGGENIFDQRIDNPIIDAQNPFSEYFDSSVVWGPIFGRNFYMGVRWRIKNKNIKKDLCG
jgi:outer membrane cobalamin receptor